MNEKTWESILPWEQVLAENKNLIDSNQSDESFSDLPKGPKLLKFIGRPADLSPKARMKHLLFNYPLPFDRHDWTILRHDGTQV